MKTTTITVIDAPATHVFPWLEDTDKMKQWLPNLVEDIPLTEQTTGLGARFRQVYHERGKDMEMTGEVTAYAENERMRAYITADMFDLDVDYHLKALNVTQTELTQYTEIKFKGFIRVMKPLMVLMSKLSKKDHTAEAHAVLKDLVEAEYRAAS